MRIPGPWFAKWTSWYLRVFELLDRRQQFIESMHKKHGSVVQLAPRTISINSIKGLQEVYSVTKKFDRPPLPMFHAYGSENLVSTVDAHLHNERRKPMRRLYAKRSIDSDDMQMLFRKKAKALAQYCGIKSQSSQPVDTKLALQLMMAEIMSEVIYGKNFALNLFHDDEQRSRMVANIKSQDNRMISLASAISVWFPQFVFLLRRWNLAPYPLNGMLPEGMLLHQLGIAAMDSAKQTADEEKPSTHPSVMQVLVDNYGQRLTPEVRNYILSECYDHFWAGVNTTTDAMVPLMFQLSIPKNVHQQQRLHQELSNLSPKADATELQFLNSIIKEALRIHPPVIGSLDRITTEPITVDGVPIPEDAEIGAQAYSLHRNANVFASPNEWRPERWDVDPKSDGLRSMNRHLFAFGHGPRMCIGMNMGLDIMRHSVAAIYSTFRTTLPEDLVAAEAGSQEKKMKKWIRDAQCPIRFEAL